MSFCGIRNADCNVQDVVFAEDLAVITNWAAQISCKAPRRTL